MPCWKKRVPSSQTANLARLAAEVAEHKRDPYTLVEDIAASIGKS